MALTSKEPNIAANDVAQQAVSQQNNNLQQEIDNLKTELDMRRNLASNSPTAILQRAQIRRDGSKGIFTLRQPFSNGLKSGETVQKASSKATRRLIVLTSCKILRKETHHDIHRFKAWTT
ncbi:hypothetical protein AO286_00860 [Pseudomonas syringae]|nr:hypothetical protein AO286_00860 [Pseudomonas syringae]